MPDFNDALGIDYLRPSPPYPAQNLIAPGAGASQPGQGAAPVPDASPVVSVPRPGACRLGSPACCRSHRAACSVPTPVACCRGSGRGCRAPGRTGTSRRLPPSPRARAPRSRAASNSGAERKAQGAARGDRGLESWRHGRHPPGDDQLACPHGAATAAGGTTICRRAPRSRSTCK